MTALTLPTPQLVGADLLKLRRSRSLGVVTFLLTVGAVVATVAIMETLHLVNSAKHGPVGGVPDLAHFASLIGLLGGAAAAIVGARIGAGDRDAGVYRDLVVTGRSRLALYLSRYPAGGAFLFAFVTAAYAFAAVASVVLAGSNPAPDTRLLVVTGLWTVLNVGVFYILSVAIASLLGSRSYAIGIILALRFALTPIIASISALGVVRELIPGIAIESITPAALANSARMAPHVPASSSAVAAVLLVWTIVAVVAGGWRDVTKDA